MIGSVLRASRRSAVVQRGLWLGLLVMGVCGGGWAASWFWVPNNPYRTAPWVYEYDLPPSPLQGLGDLPETYLQRVQHLIGQQDHEGALVVTTALTERFPHFQLGQWLHGEILSSTAGLPVVAPENNPDDPGRSMPNLLKELKVRTQAWRQPYVEGTVPLGVGHLDRGTPYLAVVDASISRLYLFKNASTDQQLKLTLVFDTYVTVGLNGLHKKAEGDKRSPVGVYFTQHLLPGKRLPDLYGAGALTLDYPSTWDSAQGRTGSGIWIHGTPSAQYSRAPQASDGCIVVPNDAMVRLMDIGHPRGLPIFIQENIEWIPAAQAQASGRALITALSSSPAQSTWAVRWSPQAADAPQGRMLHLFSWREEGRQIAMTEIQNGQHAPDRQYWVQQAPQGWVRFHPWSTDHQSL